MPDGEIETAKRAGFGTSAEALQNDDDDALTVHGVAMAPGVVNGMNESGEASYYSSDVLEDAADGLVGRNIVDDSEHDDLEATQPSNSAIVGEVTNAKYKPNVGVVYQGTVSRDPEKSLIENGHVDVSPAIFRQSGEYDDEKDARHVDEIVHWRDLSVVPDGASEDASIQAGPAEALQAEALRAVFSPDDDTEAEAHAAPTTAHSPTYEGTATQNWSVPTMSDFDTDDLSEIDNHYLVSTSGFPPAKFSDLALPVVSPSGKLHKQALKRMKTHAAQVTGLSGNTLERVKTQIDNLLDKEFDESDASGDSDTEAESNSPAHAGVRGDSKADNGELSAETMSVTGTEQSDEESGDGSDGGDGGSNNDNLKSKSKGELVDMVRELRETMAELKGQVKALDGDVDNLKSNFAPLEEHVIEAFAQKHNHDEEFVRENFDTAELIDELGGPEATGEVLGLSPNPQTGDPDPTSEKGGGLANLNSDDKSEIENLAARAETFDAIDEEHAETLRQRAAEVADAEEWDDIEGEVV